MYEILFLIHGKNWFNWKLKAKIIADKARNWIKKSLRTKIPVGGGHLNFRRIQISRLIYDNPKMLIV